jgi:hypothetical protein
MEGGNLSTYYQQRDQQAQHPSPNGQGSSNTEHSHLKPKGNEPHLNPPPQGTSTGETL